MVFILFDVPWTGLFLYMFGRVFEWFWDGVPSIPDGVPVGVVHGLFFVSFCAAFGALVGC